MRPNHCALRCKFYKKHPLEVPLLSTVGRALRQTVLRIFQYCLSLRPLLGSFQLAMANHRLNQLHGQFRVFGVKLASCCNEPRKQLIMCNIS
jgi:hypothetical protein